MDGIIAFASPAEHTIWITFDDGKTDREKITDVKGGVTIPGEKTPTAETPFSYK
jgi:hypothetical protein